MKISECMSRDIQVAAPDDSMATAARIMADIDVGFLPVGDKGQLIGIVTDRDIAIRGVAAGKPPGTCIREVMSRAVNYCFESDDIDDVLGNLGRIQIRRLPVVDHGKRLVGVVSLCDLARSARPARVGEVLSNIARPGTSLSGAV